MPPKKRNYRKRRPRRRRNNPRSLAPTATLPLGKTFKFNTRYFDRGFALNAGVTLAASHVFRANDLFDPDYTGIGHQPIGFDQMMQMYRNYTVIGSKITVTFRNSDATNPQMVGIMLKDSPGTLTDVRQIVENGNVTHALCNPAGDDNSQRILTYKCSPAKFLGRPNILSEDELRGTASTSAPVGAYYHVWSYAPNGADPGNLDFHVQIEYTAVLTEPVKLTLS